jgi:CRISPR-associated protein (TIGR02710 family)
MSSEPTNTKALILSVGGTAEPLVKAILHHAPGFVCFFASQATADKTATVKESVKQSGLDVQSEIELVDDQDDLLHCYEKAGAAIQRVVRKGYGDKDAVIVDYTGGTKNMSVALSLAAIQKGYCFSYVGGEKRTKSGVGIVETGHEKVYTQVNPWDFLAVRERQQAAQFFNACQFKACRELLADLADKASARRTTYKRLVFAVDAFYQWDLFRHQEALECFRRAKLDELRELEDQGVRAFAESCAGLVPYLEKVIACSDKGRKPCRELSHDLFANAERRFAEGKVDDAVLRLYRLVEMLAQQRLLEGFDIDAADVRPEQIPASIRNDFVKEYRQKRDGKIKIPQAAAFSLLAALKDELGERYWQGEKRFRDIQSARNTSYLAHGFNSSKEKVYETLRDFVLGLGAVDEGRLPVFPVMSL